MKIQWVSMLAFTVIIGLQGCGSDSSTSTPAASAPALPVTTISGTTIDMAGVWKETCYSSAGVGTTDWLDTVTFTGQAISVVTTAYTSADLSCTGTTSEAGTVSANVATAADEIVIGWVFSAGGTATAPAAVNVSGIASFTKVNATITAATGTFGTGGANVIPIGTVTDISHVVDDTGAKPRAYTINYAFSNSTANVDDYFTKQ